MKKYICVNYTENLMSRGFMSDKIKQHKEVLSNSEFKRELIKNFIEQDKCSRMCPGKKGYKKT